MSTAEAFPSAASTALGVADGDAATLAQALTESAANLPGTNTANAAASTLKVPKSDAVRSAFSAVGSRASGAYITNPLRGSVDDLNIGRDASRSIEELSKVDDETLTAMAKKAGTPLPANDKEYAELKNRIALDAMSQSVGVEFKSLSALGVTLDPTESELAKVAATSGLLSEQADFAKYMKTMSSGLTPTAMAGMLEGFTAGLPKIAQDDGSLIGGLFGDIDFEVLDLIKKVASTALGIATDLMCNKFTNYRNRQNLFNGLLALAAGMGALCALLALIDAGTTSGLYNNSSKRILRKVIRTSSAGGMVEVVEEIVSEVGPGTVPNSRDIMRTLARDGYSPGLYNQTSYSNLMTEFGLGSEAIFGVDAQPSSSRIIWDENRVGSSYPSLTNNTVGFPISKLTKRDRPVSRDISWF
jgi:hypothetical protein